MVANNQTSGSLAAAYVGSRTGVNYKLGKEIGSGGNGVVYSVSRRPELVAKIQRYALSKDDVDKLDLLVRGVTPELLSVAAWPIDSLRSRSGEVVGFVMPRILDARPLHELYSPRARIQHFPSADFRFLVHAAANLARLFAAVHEAGFICGDVNHANVLVRPSGTVAAVDCDSFQVGDGSRFPCLVGTELFVPPELMGQALFETRRTTNHDNYGLAILIFHLLFMGRHPLAGRFVGRGEMPFERAIAESRYAYSVDERRTRMQPPPLTPPVAGVGRAVANLFEKAFHPDSQNGRRPRPQEWINALEALQASLVPCDAVGWHYHLPSVKPCPWCLIEGTARIKLFGGVVNVSTATISDLDSLWARYLALISPPKQTPKLKRSWNLGNAAPRLPKPKPVQRAAKSFITAMVESVKVGVDNLITVGAVLILAGTFAWKNYHQPNSTVRSILDAAASLFDAHGKDPMVISLLAVLALAAATVVTDLVMVVSKAPAREAKPRNQPRNSFWQKLHDRFSTRRNWSKAVDNWKALPAPPDVSDLESPIQWLKQQLDALALERDERIKACAAPEPVDEQVARYLGALRIEDARLNNIGPSRCAVLRSWGIDTAADVAADKISEIPGFGKNLTEKLVVWREEREAAFIPHTGVVVSPLEVQQIDRQLAARRAKLMKQLREKIAEVERRMAPYLQLRQSRWAEVEKASSIRTQ